jgi:hypothetical protein
LKVVVVVELALQAEVIPALIQVAMAFQLVY